MKRACIGILLITLVFSCKSDKKEDAILVKENTKEERIKTKLNKFESKLIDLREVNQQFTPELKVEKFGMQKINDSAFSFVFKLNPSTEETTVSKYSFGVRAFYAESSEPYKSNFTPSLRTIGENKYIILRNKLKEVSYLDSLYVFIYKRKNFKESGKLGDIKIRDILIEKDNE